MRDRAVIRRPLWLARWVSLGLAAGAAGLVPWAFMLGVTLPATHHSQRWALAWAGFDGMLAAGIGLTAWLAYRHDARAGLVAAGTAALALVDAWFDVMTAQPGAELTLSVLLALVGELPLAAFCGCVAVSAHRSLTCRVPVAVPASLRPLLAA